METECSEGVGGRVKKIGVTTQRGLKYLIMIS
jgi:hypothetical protein